MQLRRGDKGRKRTGNTTMTISQEVPALSRMSPPESTRPKNQYTNVEGGDVSTQSQYDTIKNYKGRKNKIKSIINRINNGTKLKERSAEMEDTDRRVAPHSPCLDLI